MLNKQIVTARSILAMQGGDLSWSNIQTLVCQYDMEHGSPSESEVTAGVWVSATPQCSRTVFPSGG